MTDQPVEVLAVIAGAELPEPAEQTGTVTERFDRFVVAVLAYEQAYDRTVEGADPTTKRRLKRLRSRRRRRSRRWVADGGDPMSDEDVMR